MQPFVGGSEVRHTTGSYIVPGSVIHSVVWQYRLLALKSGYTRSSSDSQILQPSSGVNFFGWSKFQMQQVHAIQSRKINLRPTTSKRFYGVALLQHCGTSHRFLLPLAGAFSGLEAIAELHNALSMSEGVKPSPPTLSSFKTNTRCSQCLATN
jgi:hypothetical protein